MKGGKMAPTQAGPVRGIVGRQKLQCHGLKRKCLPTKGSSVEGISTQGCVQGWGSRRCEQIHEYTDLINGLIC